MKLMPSVIAIALFSIAMQADFARATPVFSSQVLAAQANGTKNGSEAKKPKSEKKQKKEKKEKAKKGGGVTFHEGSAESRAERDRRLTRECRGRPNAGLCEGYARP